MGKYHSIQKNPKTTLATLQNTEDPKIKKKINVADA
jgi:hypothetical protein